MIFYVGDTHGQLDAIKKIEKDNSKISLKLGQICLFITGIIYIIVGIIFPETNADLEAIQAADAENPRDESRPQR